MNTSLSSSSWYSLSTEDKLTPDHANEAYIAAIKHFREKLTADECKRIWLNDKYTISDVQQALEDAKSTYEVREKHAQAHKWVEKLSSRVLYYGEVLDTLSQHHPEYVSLVWGAIKFVFIGVLNHGELVIQLSKALSYIADALPHVELKSILYPTERMRNLVSLIYSQIIKFVIRAVNWYKQGKLKHIITSITQPYSLRFKDLLDDIATSSRQLDRLAAAAAMVEQRDMHVEQINSHKLLLEMRDMIQTYQGLTMASLVDTNKRVCDIQLSQILTFTASASLQSPEASRKLCSAIRNRRRSQDGSSKFFSSSPQLQSWSSATQSACISINGSFATRYCAKNFAVDIIDLISVSKIPVIWVLNPGLKLGDGMPITTDILKHLVLQILQLNQQSLTEKSLSLNAAQFQCAKSEEDWFELLVSVLMGLPLLYVVIDLEILESAFCEKILVIEGFRNLIKRLSSGAATTVIKIAFISYLRSVPTLVGEELRIPKSADTVSKTKRRNRKPVRTGRSKNNLALKLTA